MRTINKDLWNRKFQFEKFSAFNSPFFNICADVDVTAFYAYVKAQNISFFQASYFLVMKTINVLEPFRYRIRNGEIVVLDEVKGSCPILNEDDTFTYCYFEYHPDFPSFEKHAQEVLQEHRNGEGPTHRPARDDIFHSSIIPWVSFNSFEHAKIIGGQDTVPKVVLGKYFSEGDKMKMPLSVSGHHALMDGLHVGLYFKRFQEYLAEPEKSLS